MTQAGLPQLIARGDLDELVREVDRCARQAAWDRLVTLRDACRTAVEDAGKQLWGVAHFADYRIALDGPAELAAAVVQPGAGRFALGPLSEVVAQNHPFGSLAEHLDGTVTAVVAQERTLRGEDLRDDPRAAMPEAALPRRLEPWEPAYVLPRYRADDRLDGQPPDPPADPGLLPTGAAAATRSSADAHDLVRALNDLAAAWRDESDGDVAAVVVDGTAVDAVRSLGGGGGWIARCTLGHAFAVMAFAAASGGVRGRRRGGAAGRSAAWWVGAVATGMDDVADPDEFEFALEDLRWHVFERDDAPAGGWRLRVAVENPAAGWSAAVEATDRPVGTDTDDAARWHSQG